MDLAQLLTGSSTSQSAAQAQHPKAVQAATSPADGQNGGEAGAFSDILGALVAVAQTQTDNQSNGQSNGQGGGFDQQNNPAQGAFTSKLNARLHAYIAAQTGDAQALPDIETIIAFLSNTAIAAPQDASLAAANSNTNGLLNASAQASLNTSSALSDFLSALDISEASGTQTLSAAALEPENIAGTSLLDLFVQRTGLQPEAIINTFGALPPAPTQGVDLNSAPRDPALLSASPFTPQQLTALQDLAARIESGEITQGIQDDPALAAFINSLVQIIPPQNLPHNTALDDLPDLLAVHLKPQAGGQDAPQPLAGQLNALVTGDAQGGDLLSQTGVLPAPPEETGESFDALVQKAATGETANSGEAPRNFIRNADLAQNQGRVHDGAQAQILTGGQDSLTLSSDPQSLPLDEHFSFSISSGVPTASSAIITQAQSATQAHPATQMVAATLQKGIQGGDSSNITLRLDPPELGRIQISMDFHKDKSLKALVTVEKPEAYMMLQRDSHTLERALQNSGLDMNGDGGLQFELAQDGSFFDHGGNERGGGHDQGGTGAGGSGGLGHEEVIETTMTWHVDPQTGHMHYNLIV
ncbi:MAG: flagellar hook-length control protein FliK [Bdellovibrionales bacterium]